MDHLVGTVIGKYRLLERIGGSAEGDVYKGVQVGLDREVAVRLLTPEQAGDARTLTRFRQEARATAQLSHPNVLTVYDSGKHEALRYLVMEFLDTGTLATRLRQGPLPLEDALALAEDLARALAYVHDRGLTHRYVVPRNVRFDFKGKAILSGFGSDARDLLARVDAQGEHGYMSPEVLLAENVGPPSDLYQFGAVLYEALCGRLPYPGRPPFVAGGGGYEQAIRPPRQLREEVSEDLEELLLTCLRADPSERPGSSEELVKSVVRVRRKYAVRQVSKRVAKEGAPGLQAAPAPTKAVRVDDLAAPLPTARVTTQPKVVEAVRLLTGGHGDVSQRETQIRLALVLGPVLLILAAGGLYLAGAFTSQGPQLLEARHTVRGTEVEVSWRASRPCYGFLEYSEDGGASQRTIPPDAKRALFQQTLQDLRPDKAVTYRIGLSDAPDGSGASFGPEQTARTEAAQTIEDLRVEGRTHEGVVVRWTTSLPSDSRVRYWRGGGGVHLVDNPGERRQTEHRVEVRGLQPATTYQFRALASDQLGEDVTSPEQTFTTRSLPDSGGGGAASRAERHLRRLGRLSEDELYKLEGSLGDVLLAERDLDLEQKVLLVLTHTRDAPGFRRRLRLASRWIEELERAGRAVPSPPSWARSSDLGQALGDLETAHGTGDGSEARRRLDECLQLLARADRIPLPSSGSAGR